MKGVPQLLWHDADKYLESHIQSQINHEETGAATICVRILTFWDKLWKTWAFLVKKVG